MFDRIFRGRGNAGQGRGQGAGRGAGQGRGGQGSGGRGDGDKPGSGPGGNCVCPHCGHQEPHVAGQRCLDQTCPKCGTKMTRQ